MRQLRFYISLLLLCVAVATNAQQRAMDVYQAKYSDVSQMTFITQDSITYGIVAPDTVGVFHIDKHNAVIPPTILDGGNFYTVGGICCNPEAIGDNVATVTFPDAVSFDHFYHTKGAYYGLNNFYFSAGTRGKNLQKFSWPENSTTSHETLFVNGNSLYVKPSASDTIAYLVCIPPRQSSPIRIHPLSVNGSRVKLTYVYEWALSMADSVVVNIATTKKDLLFNPGSINSSNIKAFTFRRATTDTNYGDLPVNGSTIAFRVLYSGGNLIHYCTRNEEEKYTVLDSTRIIGTTAFKGNEHIKEVVLPEGLLDINPGAFQDCKNLATVNFPFSLIRIREDAFWNCTAMTGTLDLSDHRNLETIDYSAFQATNLDSLSLNGCGRLQYIGNTAFWKTRITGIDFRGCDALQRIDRIAFFGCKLKKLNLSPLTALVSIGDSAFTDNDITGTLDLDSCYALRTIGNSAFRNNKITWVTNLGAAVKQGAFISSIGDNAFRNNRIARMLSLVNVVSVGDYAFHENDRLSYVIIDKALKHLGNSAISNARWFRLYDTTTFAENSYGDLMSADGTRLLCVAQRCHTKNADGTWKMIGNYYDGEDRIIPSTVKTIDDQAFYKGNVKHAVLPTGLTTMPNLDPNTTEWMTIPSAALSYALDNKEYKFGLASKTDTTCTGTIDNIKLIGLGDATLVDKMLRQFRLNRIRSRKAIATVYVSPTVYEKVTKGLLVPASYVPNVTTDIPVTLKSTYMSFSPDYPCYFDDPIVEIVTKVDMDNKIVYTKTIPQGSDGKYHVPARTGAQQDTYHGVILHGTPGTTYYCHIDDSIQNAASVNYDDSPFLPSPVCKWLDVSTDKDMLVLNGGVFRTVQNSGIINWGKAYLLVDKTADAKPWSIASDSGEYTGIDTIQREGSKSSTQGFWYNIVGQRVSKPAKGHLYIHNGRTVIYK